MQTTKQKTAQEIVVVVVWHNINSKTHSQRRQRTHRTNSSKSVLFLNWAAYLVLCPDTVFIFYFLCGINFKSILTSSFFFFFSKERSRRFTRSKARLSSVLTWSHPQWILQRRHKIESEVGLWVFFAKDIVSEQSRTRLKTRISFTYQ